MAIIEPGSLNLDTIHLRIGGAKTSDRAELKDGNKFVVVEHFVDPEGTPVDAGQFDVQRMCFSLFVAPEKDDQYGRHRNVLCHHRRQGKIGRIVGGGLLRVLEDQGVILGGYSTDFDSEPLAVRQKLAQLLIPELGRLLVQGNLHSKQVRADVSHVNLYWIRFRQILDQLKEYFGPVMQGEVNEKITQYRQREEYYGGR